MKEKLMDGKNKVMDAGEAQETRWQLTIIQNYIY